MGFKWFTLLQFVLVRSKSFKICSGCSRLLQFVGFFCKLFLIGF